MNGCNIFSSWINFVEFFNFLLHMFQQHPFIKSYDTNNNIKEWFLQVYSKVPNLTSLEIETEPASSWWVDFFLSFYFPLLKLALILWFLWRQIVVLVVIHLLFNFCKNGDCSCEGLTFWVLSMCIFFIDFKFQKFWNNLLQILFQSNGQFTREIVLPWNGLFSWRC